MNSRAAKRKAYGIAAEALRQAMETDLVNQDELDDDDAGRLYMACEALQESFARRATKNFEERRRYR